MGFFSKPEEKKPAPVTPVSRPKNTVSPSPAASPAPTLIGPAAHITGEIMSSDNIQVEGKVEGKIKCTRQVVIGEIRHSPDLFELRSGGFSYKL